MAKRPRTSIEDTSAKNTESSHSFKQYSHEPMHKLNTAKSTTVQMGGNKFDADIDFASINMLDTINSIASASTSSAQGSGERSSYFKN